MTLRKQAFLAGAALIAVGAVAYADAKSDALVKKARQVTAKATTMEAEVAGTFEAGGQKQSISGTFRAMKPNYLYFKGKTGDGEGNLTVSDGKNIYEVNEAQKEYTRAEAAAKGQDPIGLPGGPIGVFFDPDSLDASGAKYAGTKKINGRDYQAVQRTIKQGMPMSQTLYFGASGLMEGMSIRMSAQGQTFTASFWLKNIRLNTPLKAEQFAYAPPADFQVRKGPEESLLAVGTPAPDFNLPTPTGGRLGLSDALKGKKAVLVNFWFYG
jgi:outer membrane lipoprotein-sorting protein